MPSRRLAPALILALIAVALGPGPVSPPTVHAADHRDAPITRLGPAADIADSYVFRTYSGPPHSPFLTQFTITTGGSDLPGAFNVEIFETPDGRAIFFSDPLFTPPGTGAVAAGGISVLDLDDPAFDFDRIFGELVFEDTVLPQPTTFGTRPGQGLGGPGTTIVDLALQGSVPGLGLIEVTPATEAREFGFVQGQGDPNLTLLDLDNLPDRAFPNDSPLDPVRDARLLRLLDEALALLDTLDAESGGLSGGRFIGAGGGSSFTP